MTFSCMLVSLAEQVVVFVAAKSLCLVSKRLWFFSMWLLFTIPVDLLQPG